MPLSVSVVGPDCGNIAPGIVGAFDALGCKAEAFVYGRFEAEWMGVRVVRRITDPGYEARIAQSFNVSLCAALQRKPDLLLVLKGDALSDTSKGRLTESRSIVLSWALDSLSRCPAQASIWPWARHAFVVDGGDAGAAGKAAVWLPLGYDETIYKPGAPKDIDVLFLGRLGKRYSSRRRYLNCLATSGLSRRYAIAFIGDRENRVLNLSLIGAARSLRWVAGCLAEPDLARYIARSRICINVFQDDGVAPINPMFFAIPGSRTCQLTPDRDYLGGWLKPGVEVATFPDGKLVDCLDRLLSDPATVADESEAGFQKAAGAHTYKHRVQTLLGAMGID
jgi:hypothetical protein